MNEKGKTLTTLNHSQFCPSFPLRSILTKNLTVSASNNGTIEDVKDALEASLLCQIEPVVEVVEITQLNDALDRIRQGRVMGKLLVRLDTI